MTHHGDTMVTWPLLPAGTWLALLWGWCQKLAQDPTVDSWETQHKDRELPSFGPVLVFLISLGANMDWDCHFF